MVDCTIVGWRAWYTGGRKFDSLTTRWEDLPPEGALYFVLYQRTRGRRRIMQGQTLYWHDPQTDVWACDNTADADIRPDLPRRFIKRGKWVSDQEFYEIKKLAWSENTSPDESLCVDEFG